LAKKTEAKAWRINKGLMPIAVSKLQDMVPKKPLCLPSSRWKQGWSGKSTADKSYQNRTKVARASKAK